MLCAPLVAAKRAVALSLGAGLPLLERTVPLLPHQLRQWQLRDYQEEILLKAIRLMQLGFRRILLQLPTGGGKTVMAAALLGSASLLGYTSQFIVHRQPLVKQTSGTFTELGINHGFIASGWAETFDARVILAGVQTLANRLGLVLPPNLVVLDEAHHATAATWDTVLRAYPDAFIIGLTATPERLDGRGLSDHFDVMVVGPSVAELIARGYLSPFDYYAPPGFLEVQAAGSDEAANDLLARPQLIGDMVEHYLRLAPGESGLVFASSREHSRQLVDAFRGNGVRAAHVDGSMSQGERDRIDEAFRARDFDILSSVDLIGEGYDVPGVVYCGLGRRTQSRSLYRQQVGRDLRPFYAPGMPRETDEQRLAAIAAGSKPAGIICDHAGNVFRHGFPDADITWSLAGKIDRARGGGNDDAISVKTCLTCYRVSPSTVARCPGCDTEFTVQARKLIQKEGQLEKLEREALKKAESARLRAQEKACRSYRELYDLAVARGHQFPKQWANHMLAGRAKAHARFKGRR